MKNVYVPEAIWKAAGKWHKAKGLKKLGSPLFVISVRGRAGIPVSDKLLNRCIDTFDNLCLAENDSQALQELDKLRIDIIKLYVSTLNQ